MMNRKIILLFLIAFAMSSCSKKAEVKVTPIVEDTVDYAHLELDINPNGLQGDLLSIANKINKKERVSFAKLTRLMVQKHLDEYKGDTGEYKKIDDVLATLNSINMLDDMRLAGGPFDMSDLKVTFETVIQGDTKKDFIYNKQESNILSRLVINKAQCYSGTYIMQVLLRLTSLEAFNEINPVVIFESGHVLPGYVVAIEDSFELFGVEMTNNGRALKKYGKTKNLNREMIVISAHDFAIVEIYKNDLKNSQDVVFNAKDHLAKLYNIDLITTSPHAKGKSNASIDRDDVLNATPFGFGDTSHIPEGDIANIDRLDEVSLDSGGGNGPVRYWVNASEISEIDGAYLNEYKTESENMVFAKAKVVLDGVWKNADGSKFYEFKGNKFTAIFEHGWRVCKIICVS